MVKIGGGSPVGASRALAEARARSLRAGQTVVWRRDAPAADVITMAEVVAAAARFDRFAPVLRHLFPASGWDGRVRSALLDYRPGHGLPEVLVKADHALPMTGSIKARGGVHELLCQIERIAARAGIVLDGDIVAALTGATARTAFSRHTIIVASTGNLGFSIGLVARAFGLQAEIHMSRDAKDWKKARLRALGATVVEHVCDFNGAVDAARQAATGRSHAYFVDDETSRELMLGYAVAAGELAGQLERRGIRIGPDCPLHVYLPCGVGGAPGGVTFGLKHLFGRDAVCVFVEPTASACMLAALDREMPAPVHVGEIGLHNITIADGLAVPRASPLAVAVVGKLVDGVVTVNDDALLHWVVRLWQDAGLRLEPAAAAGFAALRPWIGQAPESAGRGVHVVWTTGGSLMPDEQFDELLDAAGS